MSLLYTAVEKQTPALQARYKERRRLDTVLFVMPLLTVVLFAASILHSQLQTPMSTQSIARFLSTVPPQTIAAHSRASGLVHSIKSEKLIAKRSEQSEISAKLDQAKTLHDAGQTPIAQWQIEQAKWRHLFNRQAHHYSIQWAIEREDYDEAATAVELALLFWPQDQILHIDQLAIYAAITPNSEALQKLESLALHTSRERRHWLETIKRLYAKNPSALTALDLALVGGTDTQHFN
ncbi:MAG: hypothetical protein HWE20_10770 [Gammaproteobacteria bacterium]|nr:hypothetical protein [Gammaproteobacteria bacterium]